MLQSACFFFQQMCRCAMDVEGEEKNSNLHYFHRDFCVNGLYQSESREKVCLLISECVCVCVTGESGVKHIASFTTRCLLFFVGF